jgi:hypothetical protein
VSCDGGAGFGNRCTVPSAGFFPSEMALTPAKRETREPSMATPCSLKPVHESLNSMKDDLADSIVHFKKVTMVSFKY